MSVYKRKNSAFYWCSFSIGGRRYQQSTDCFTKADARSFEHTEIQRIKRLVELGKVKDAVRKDHFLGDRIQLDDAWDKFRGLSGKRPRSQGREAATKSRWEDCLAFVKEQYPQVKLVCDVSAKAAQEYVAHIRSSGLLAEEG